MTKEIERKFLIKDFPFGVFENNKKIKPTEFITQSYISITDQSEVRVRESWTKTGESKHVLTYKNGNGLVRGESEIEIDGDTFKNLLKSSEPITKVRHYFMLNGVPISIDTYTGKLYGLVVAEVEFKSEGEALSYVPPDEAFSDVTDDKKYKNKNLWLSIQ
jgi:CYTH domain-containing protein